MNNNHSNPRCRSLIDNVTDEETTSGVVLKEIPYRDSSTTYNVPPTSDAPCRQGSDRQRHAGFRGPCHLVSKCDGSFRVGWCPAVKKSPGKETYSPSRTNELSGAILRLILTASKNP